jgi:hypothetical protein
VSSLDSLIILGGFYELGDGRIVRIYEWDKENRMISYAFVDGIIDSMKDRVLIERWKIRFDLKDFPGSKDPSLPYLFFLKWQIHRRSELISLIIEQQCYYQIDYTLLETMVENNIVLTKEENSFIKKESGSPANSFRFPRP